MTKKIYVVLTLCLLFIGLPISATAQKATVIKGIVRDSITHEPISYASVFFVGSDKGLMTDDDGKFAVSVRDNFLNVRFSTLGYREKTVFVKKGAENDLVINFFTNSTAGLFFLLYFSFFGFTTTSFKT